MMTRGPMTLTMLQYFNDADRKHKHEGMMMTRGRMTLTVLYYLNDDDGKHDHQREDDDKRADDLDDA